MNLDKLKESARRFEQKEDWRRAIEVYQRALGELETQGDPMPDPSVYNRVGDLQMKVADIPGAVRSYEHALELYADQGFFNNAIALGGKILRVDPGRTATYLRLAQLHARKNVVPDVRRHLGDYLARMAREHRLPQAIEALRGFADKFCRDAEMRAAVADLLAQAAPGGEPGGALDVLLTELRAREGQGDHGTLGTPTPSGPGQVRGLVFLDTEPDWTPAGGPEGPRNLSEIEPVLGLNLVQATLDSVESGLPLDGLESIEFTPADALTVSNLEGLDRDESIFGDGPGLVSPDARIQLDGMMDDPVLGLVGEVQPDLALIPLMSVESADIEVAFDEPPIGLMDALGTDIAPLDFESGEPTIEFLDLSEPGTVRADHSALAIVDSAADGDPIAAAEERVARHEATETWDAALEAAAELVRLEPQVIPRYQKQVELAYRAGDRDGLTLRYLELGDALLRAGMRAPAVAVYRRVLEHEPGHPRALGALASLGVAVDLPAPPPSPPEPGPPGGYIDLGALILDDQPVRDSRMRVESAEPSEPDNEDATFREILDQFKRGIDENLDSEDYQAHYDLGIAFQEMGLLDEAIAQFQRALRSPVGRLKASEALGIAFHDKGRHAIAEAVLTRAIEGLPGSEDEKIGLIYWLGRSLEAQGKEVASLGWYERALAVDIRFLDLAERIARLGAGRAS